MTLAEASPRGLEQGVEPADTQPRPADSSASGAPARLSSTPMPRFRAQLARRQQRGAEKQPDTEADRGGESHHDQLAPADPMRQVQAGGEGDARARCRTPSGLPARTAIGRPHVPGSSA